MPGTAVCDRVRRLAGWPGDALDRALEGLAPGQFVVARRPGLDPERPAVEVAKVSMRETVHVRHRHKYIADLLPPPRHFHFRSGDGRITGASAGNLAEFHRELARCPGDVVRHHADRHDFSRWFDEVFADSDLAAAAHRIEAEGQARRDMEETRAALLLEIETRYLGAG